MPGSAAEAGRTDLAVMSPAGIGRAMTASDILRAERVTLREFRASSKYCNRERLQILTIRGKPKLVMVPYKIMIDFLDNKPAPPAGKEKP